MKGKILITGGAGFIGSHLTDALIEQGYAVRILDNLCEQVHGSGSNIPGYLNPEAEFMYGDVCDKKAVEYALRNVDAVFHLAAKVGVGQSMYEIREYTAVNNFGTSVLLEALIKNPVKKLIVASSMSIYGEGLYVNDEGDKKMNCKRNISDLKKDVWEINQEGHRWYPIPTPEDKEPNFSSVYALSKYDQEKLCLITGAAYRIPTVALRFFNVYGTRQALSNPYTGVLAIFASRLLNGQSPLIFEDGNQKRDFIHVKDVARACIAALELSAANREVFNVGSGNQYTVTQIAQKLAKVMNVDIAPEATGQYRIGDMRHCFADISKIKRLLNFTPQVNFDEGLTELAEWLKTQAAVDNISNASIELGRRGLTV
jgi:dTDP-L-rhamnose 4-epimerase